MVFSPVWQKGLATGMLAPLAPGGWGLTRLGSGAPSIPQGPGVGWGRGVGWAARAEADVAPGGVGVVGAIVKAQGPLLWSRCPSCTLQPLDGRVEARTTIWI